ncbi:MAG: Re/Si-specific NAD(P)(+) transhydrogenase subunit alpha [Spirochaetia bacterium]|nr:Re/Si-specific NAD(P)(+) transhydrogenase subunit alpha [Spirochaetia bacterium]
MNVGVPKERNKNETRVALTPESAKRLIEKGFKVFIEKGAGDAAFCTDTEYKTAGAAIVSDYKKLCELSDIIVKVKSPETYKGKSEISYLKSGAFLICLQDPINQPKKITEYNKKKIVSLALEFIPRSTLAQSMDVLSSMASLAGYKAVLIGAESIPKIMPMMMTAAGTISAAKVLVIGAGVAGLQAIATSKRLGATVDAFDTRPQVKEEVMSLGAKFIDLPLTAEMQDEQGYAKLASPEFIKLEMELIDKYISKADICITTALVFGRKAPVLIKDYMVKNMRPGSIIVDLAAEAGGNCELTKPGKIVDVNGVKIYGIENLPAQLPYVASRLFSKNVENLLLHIVRDGKINLDDKDDAILQRILLTRDGALVSEIVKSVMKK